MSCDSSAPPTCAPGAECPDAPAPDPDCGSPELIRYCFPKRDDCTKDSDCKPDWTCTVLPEDARKDPPPSWEGATQICLPVSVALAITDKIKLGDSDFGGGASASDSKSTAEMSPATNKTKNGGDCTVANVGHTRTASGALLTLLTVFGLVLCRRRGRK